MPSISLISKVREIQILLMNVMEIQIPGKNN